MHISRSQVPLKGKDMFPSHDTDALGKADRCTSASMFCTGSGKAVELKPQSISKALSILGEDCSSSSSSFDACQQINTPMSAFKQTDTPKSACKQIDAPKSLFRRVAGKPVSLPPDTSTSVRSPFSQQKDVDNVTVTRVHENGFGLAQANDSKSELRNVSSMSPMIKFHTAGGRSLSVSSAALKRARSVLGDDLGVLRDEEEGTSSSSSLVIQKQSFCVPSNKENDTRSSFTYPLNKKYKPLVNDFVSPLRNSSSTGWKSSASRDGLEGSNLTSKFDAAEDEKKLNSNDPVSCSSGLHQNRPLIDISNKNGTVHSRINLGRRIVRGTSVSSFKMPRRSVKSPLPLHKDVTLASNCFSVTASDRRDGVGAAKVSSSYHQRMYIKEYFATPSPYNGLCREEVKWVRSYNAAMYVFRERPGLAPVGAGDFYRMLAERGASNVSQKWVSNHYRWIVWKLACYERYRLEKFLTVSNVLEELLYRYEKEVCLGQRSALKRILEGDSSPSLMMILRVSAVHLKPKSDSSVQEALRIELSDGWYSLNGVLDSLLSNKVYQGKLHMGQKLRIWGARLRGWPGPVSPLEDSSKTVDLVLHMNGTYKAHWADRLGFCKTLGSPLAFRCIKSNGGPVPLTLIGVQRVYPILYKEKVSDAKFVVRSERSEAKAMEVHDQRRAGVRDRVVAEFQRRHEKYADDQDDEDDEGARIMRLLESAEEPECLMADMTSEQLDMLVSYKAKLEKRRMSEMDRLIEKALRDFGLTEREVTSFMRVKVVGLVSREPSAKNHSPLAKEAIITVWNPSENLKMELREGQAYMVSGLLPNTTDHQPIHLQARDSMVKWRCLSSQEQLRFSPFFQPRIPTPVSRLAEVPIRSEFDTVALVLHVGRVYAHQQNKQWVFVTDASASVLAISFYHPRAELDSFEPFGHGLTGSIVAFCNLSKKIKDQVNNFWVAEANDNTCYSSNYNLASFKPLQSYMNPIRIWSEVSAPIINQLKQRILFMVGDNKLED